MRRGRGECTFSFYDAWLMLGGWEAGRLGGWGQGLDITGVQSVINMECPRDITTYVITTLLFMFCLTFLFQFTELYSKLYEFNGNTNIMIDSRGKIIKVSPTRVAPPGALGLALR